MKLNLLRYILLTLVDIVNHTLPKCSNDEEEYCMTSNQNYQIYVRLMSSCKKQCMNRGSKVTYRKKDKQKPIHQLGISQMDIYFEASPEKIFYKEYLVYDGVGMFGSIGGSLGLFIGFSLFDSLCFILDLVLDKFYVPRAQT